MEGTRSELYKVTNDIYEKLDSKKVWDIWLIIICSCFILDILLRVHDRPEVPFGSESGTIVAITVVIWTFTMSFFIYCLGKVDQRHYGIHVVDIFVRGLSTRKIYNVVCVMFAEILLLIVVSAFKLMITLFMVALFQCFMMIYVILMVLQRTSEEFALKQIRKEIKDTYKIEYVEHREYFQSTGIFGQMIYDIDYDSYDETKKLMDVLCFYNENFEQQMENDVKNDVKKYINQCSYEIAKRIYTNREDAYPIRKVMEDWFSKEDLCIEIKQGILMYMIENWVGFQKYSRLERILDREIRYYRELYIWVLVYNIYLQGFEGEAWRECYTNYLVHKMLFGEEKNDRILAISYWGQITGIEELHSLFQYIF